MSDITIKTLNTLNNSNIQTQTLNNFFIFKMLKYDFKKPGILSNKIIHLKSLYYFKQSLTRLWVFWHINIQFDTDSSQRLNIWNDI